MKIKYSPQVNSQNTVTYSFDGDVITATVDSETDTFDFSSMPNDSVAHSIKSDLSMIVIPLASKDEDGELWVTLYKPIRWDATEAERFPDWEDV